MLNPRGIEACSHPIQQVVVQEEEFQQPMLHQLRPGERLRFRIDFRLGFRGRGLSLDGLANSARTASGLTPNRSAVFWACVSISTRFPVLFTASAIAAQHREPAAIGADIFPPAEPVQVVIEKALRFAE